MSPVKLASVSAIVGALNAAGVRFIVVGGVAVTAHGYGRFTQDIDLVIRLIPPQIRGTFEALASLGYRPLVPVTPESLADSEQRTQWIREKHLMVLNFRSEAHRETPVDLFALEPFNFDEEYQRALVEDISPGVPIRIVCLATLLEMKRQAGRPQDLADIAELRLIHEGPANG